MPSGSYSDGQANTVAWLRIWITSRLASIPDSQITPDRCRPQLLDQAGDLGFEFGGVGLAGAQHQLRRRVDAARPPAAAPAGPSAW